MPVLLFFTALLCFTGCRFSGICLDDEQCKKDDASKPNTPTSTQCEGLPMEGDWSRIGVTETLNFGKDCSLRRSKCSLKGSYEAPTQAPTKDAPGIFKFRWVESKGNAADNCPPNGEYTCHYTLNDTRLALNCSNSAGKEGLKGEYVTTD